MRAHVPTLPYLSRFVAVGARRCDLASAQRHMRKLTHNDLRQGMSLLLRLSPQRPYERRPRRCQLDQVRSEFERTYACFIIDPHSSMPSAHLSFIASGTTFGAELIGNFDSYGGFSDMRWKKLPISLCLEAVTHRHFGSAPWPVTSSGLSCSSSVAMMLKHSSSDEHLGFSVFSSVTPCDQPCLDYIDIRPDSRPLVSRPA